jgi:hypothetical protein
MTIKFNNTEIEDEIETVQLEIENESILLEYGK